MRHWKRIAANTSRLIMAQSWKKTSLSKWMKNVKKRNFDYRVQCDLTVSSSLTTVSQGIYFADLDRIKIKKYNRDIAVICLLISSVQFMESDKRVNSLGRLQRIIFEFAYIKFCDEYLKKYLFAVCILQLTAEALWFNSAEKNSNKC